MSHIPYQNLDWSQVEKTEHIGETGTSYWQTIHVGPLRIRLVDYSANYLADHWCQKGHIVFCLEGSFESELQSGEKSVICKNMSYIVSDNLSSHRSYSAEGTKLLIIDGDFLK